MEHITRTPSLKSVYISLLNYCNRTYTYIVHTSYKILLIFVVQIIARGPTVPQSNLINSVKFCEKINYCYFTENIYDLLRKTAKILKTY